MIKTRGSSKDKSKALKKELAGFSKKVQDEVGHQIHCIFTLFLFTLVKEKNARELA